MEIILQTLLLSFLLGGMMFFPTVVAPTIFKSLEIEQAGSFLRKLFPSYYAFIIVVSGFAAILDDFKNPVFFICIATLISTLIIRQIMMPRINLWRDADLAGDRNAGHKFKIAHRLVMVLNIGQIIGLVYAVYFNVKML
tara:strand:+ start:88 stop:504 length:417 start_codon:yes stop_codon:yes gene_type:complete